MPPSPQFHNVGPRAVRAGGFVFRGPMRMGIRVINKTGVSIAANQIVAVTGFDVTSGKVKIVLADADVAGHDDLYVTNAAIANNAQGHVYKGFLSSANLNTNAATSAGDPVYLDATTAGGFTVTAPSAGNAALYPVGFVVVKSATVGSIYWHVAAMRKIGSNQVQSGADASVLVATGTITSANITGTGAGQLGHAQGVVLVPAGGAHVINQLVYAILINDFATAAYTGGGNTSINIGAGGAALTGVASAAQFITLAADGVVEFVPLAAAFKAYTENNPLNLVSASAPTQPGTAAGVFRYVVGYRQIATGL